MSYIMSTTKSHYHNPRIPLRTKIHIQPSFPLMCRTFPQEYARFQQQYNTIDRLIDDNPGIIDAVHDDLIKICSNDGRESTFSSEQFLRMIVVKVIEGLSLRDTIIRVADSDFLRNFTRIFSGKMMNLTALQTAMKNIDCVSDAVSYTHLTLPTIYSV